MAAITALGSEKGDQMALHHVVAQKLQRLQVLTALSGIKPGLAFPRNLEVRAIPPPHLL